MPITHITVRGARQHNLRDINVRIPRNSLTVVTGLSGSGKSSLAFDTIYAEGQRRYVETLSAYARQFLDQIERPDVDSIEGLSPAISIEQKTTSRSPRSTVGTITEIYDYLRLLYASVGTPHCPNCGRLIARQTADQIVQRILELGAGERVTVMAPVVRGRKGEFRELLDQLDRQGFRARVDGEVRDLSEPLHLDRRKNHTIEAVIDRILLKNPSAPQTIPVASTLAGKPAKPSVEKRLELAVAKALQLANGLALVAVAGGEEQLFSSSMACPDCGLDVPKLEPRSFSFNSAFGACPECHGLGSLYDLDPAKVITDWSKPLLDGGLGPGSSSQYLLKLIHLAADRYDIDLKLPFEELPPRQQHVLVYGPPKNEAPRTGFHGILDFLRDSIEEARGDSYREYMMNYMSATPCPVCRGKRLRPESLAVKIGGLSIADFTALPLKRALSAAINLSFTAREALVAERIRGEIVERLEFLCAVGLTYLALDRNATTLSGGEGQRIRLATQIGSRLRGVLYVLDEPSIGLHQRDNNRLIQALEKLRDLGNTVLVVEHDEETIRHADYVLDGPAGRSGRRPGHAGRDHGLPGVAHRALPLRRGHHAPTRPAAPPYRQLAHHHRRARTQSAGCERPHSAGRDDRGHRRQRLGQKHAHQRHFVPFAGPDPLRLARGARGARVAHRRRTGRQSRPYRPVPHRPHTALQSGHLHASFLADPRPFRPAA
jgi:excinuclease ABC subunit A